MGPVTMKRKSVECGLKRKSLPREEERQAFYKNRTADGRRNAAVPAVVPGRRRRTSAKTKGCGRRCIASMKSIIADSCS